MKVFLVAAACLTLVYIAEAASEFTRFKSQYRKDYPSDSVERYRKKVYKQNEKFVREHNERYERGEVTYKMALNHLADMHPREFMATFLGFNRSLRATNKVPEGIPFRHNKDAVIQKEVDWRQKGAISPVKDQGHCGSCWAFSSTGALEAHTFLKKGRRVSLSEQNLIDCSLNYGNNGCEGGLMEQAFQYVRDNDGIDTEEAYPYEGEDSECRFKKNNVGATDAGFVTIPSGDEQALMEAVATQGPLSIAIDASNPSFQFYSEGVYYEPECSSAQLDHGVLLVGYGVEKDQKYWLVKNSWSEQWGENGYIKMARNKDNNCGIATQASFPIVEGGRQSSEESSESS
uniref:Cathepsin L-like cysteine protease 1 n=1 Tax=Plautia stali TaxID=106108 RepID=A9CPH0_PLAST|nr:cathepsin L-like cysteine protease 1 [Plautia stali]